MMFSNSSSEAVRNYLEQAQIYAAQKQWLEAIAACKNAIILNPNSAEAYQIWGNSLQKLGRYSEAIECYLRVVEIQPDIPEVHANLGKLYGANKQWLEALKHYDRCLVLAPNFADVYRSLARIWEHLGESQKSWSYMFRALELEPGMIDAQQHLNIANKLLQQGDLERALVFYRYAIQLDGPLDEASSAIISILQQLGRKEEAKSYLQSATQIKTQSSSPGKNWSENQQSDNSINHLKVEPEKFIDETQPTAESYHLLGDKLSKQEDWQSAVQAYLKAIKLNPQFSWSYNNLGDVYLKLNQSSEAVACYRRAIALKGDFFWSYQNLGTALLNLERWSEAIETYHQAIELDDSFPWSHYNLGEGLGKLFRWSEAIEAYHRAIELKPDFAEAHAHLADALIREEHWDEGIKYYEQAIELDPGIDVAVYRSLKEALDRRKYLELASIDSIEAPNWPYTPVVVYQPPKTLPDGSPFPKISIVTPTYNQGQFIEETILSVVNQNYPNLEYILVDGASTDQTMEIVNRYREHFSYVVSESDQGQSNAINKGFRRATGEIFTWLNSDDRLAPGALYAVALAFYTSGADAVAGICQIFQNGKEIEQHLTSCANGTIPLDDILDLENCWLQGKFFYQPEVMFTRDIWERAGGEVNESLYYSMDYEMWARFAAQGATLQVIGYPIAQYRLHDQQKTSAIAKYQPELLEASKSLGKRFEIRAKVSSNLPPKERKRLKIVVLNDTGCLGGAGIAHQRIAQALTLAGHQVFPVAGTLDWSLTPVKCTPGEVLELIDSLEPDLVVVGNIHNFQRSLDILETVCDSYPTVFIMHDQWLFTGRCGYPGDCKQYTTICDADCPTWDQYPRLAPSKIADTFKRKQALVHNNDQLLVLGDSKWLTNWAGTRYQATSTNQPLENRFQSIHYGLDLQTLKPQDQKYARRQLGLPEDKFIILTGSQSLEDERKGFKYLLKALEIFNLPDIMLLCFGHDIDLDTQLNIKSVGYLNSPRLQTYYYSAADLFVSPAIEEAFGQTFIEAAACGTPAVGFRVGGITEAICDRISGRIVSQTTPEALAAMILELYGDRPQLELLSTLAPWYIASHFSLAASYHKIITAWSNSGYLNKLGMASVTKLRVDQPSSANFLTVKGGNSQQHISVQENSLPMTIMMDQSLQGTGWYPAEVVNGITARWMKKLATVVINPIHPQDLWLEIKGIATVDLELLKTIEIKVDGNLIQTTMEIHQNGVWICQGKISAKYVPSQVAFLIAIAVSETKQFSLQDTRAGSLLVGSLLIKSN